MGAIYTLDGIELANGLQGSKACDEAIQAACNAADERGEDVELVDDDGYWLVHPAVWSGGEHGNPARKCREAADFICELDASGDAYNAGWARLR